MGRAEDSRCRVLVGNTADSVGRMLLASLVGRGPSGNSTVAGSAEQDTGLEHQCKHAVFRLVAGRAHPGDQTRLQG